ARALEHVIGFENEKRQPADMVGMKMRDQDRVDVVAVDREPVHANERSSAAIDQRVDVSPDKVKTSIEPSARAERVAASDKLQLHETPSTLAAEPSPAKATAHGDGSPDMNANSQWKFRGGGRSSL